MWEFFICFAQQTYLPQLFGNGVVHAKSILEGIMDTVDMKDKPIASLWAVHGIDDTIV